MFLLLTSTAFSKATTALIPTIGTYSDYYESEHHETFSSINSTPENSMISSGLYGCVEYPMLDYDQMLDRSAVYSESRNINTLDDVCRWLCDDVDDDQELE
ncbi:hypothetical protein E3N88_33614 [Mikania micrantha]|uniref:Uncharacterized protein n=1 Tax=Mikania micrantha TaxID=192012 RepID=A0A5N6MCH6_9ASTR|nr:hypothetical protein E3N88_33614 [Mikania micrantha]